MSATTGGLKSKLRETLKQEDAALAERSRAVDRPAATKPPAMKPGAAKPRPAEPAIVDPAASNSVSEAFISPAMPVTAESGEAERSDKLEKVERSDKLEKVERDSFSMPAREHKRIKALREALGKEGVLVSKSELLRAGLALLAERDTGEIARLVAALPKVAKGKRKRR